MADRASERLQGGCFGLLPDLLNAQRKRGGGGGEEREGEGGGVGGVCAVTPAKGLFAPTDFDEAWAPPPLLESRP